MWHSYLRYKREIWHIIAYIVYYTEYPYTKKSNIMAKDQTIHLYYKDILFFSNKNKSEIILNIMTKYGMNKSNV